MFKALALSLLFSLQFAQAEILTADKITQDFEATKKQLERQELQQRQILSGLYQINKKIKKTVTERGELSQQKAFVEGSIRDLTEKVAELDHRANSQKTMLAERLKAIYQLGGQSLVRLFLSSANSSQVERNLKILGLIAARDMELIKDYTLDLADLRSKKIKLASRLEHLKSVEAKISQKEKSFLAEQNAKNKILDKIRKNKLFAINKINSLRAKSLQYNIDDSGLFDMLFRPSFSDQKGNLPRPLSGGLLQRFGLVKSADHPYTLNHKGIFISAPQGNPVQAVFEGKVSFAGELPGFGKTLIIDHGDHYYTVYAQARDLKVQLGDEVTQSQTVATVGRSPQNNSDGLYFEIRHFSEPYDPQLWMKGLSL